MKGIITKSTGSWYQVLHRESGRFYEARVRGKFKLQKTELTNPLSVGDFVSFTLDRDGIAWIKEIKPRKNYLIRKSVNLSKEAHIIASNIDIACFIFTLKMPETSLGFLDRFLVCCEAYNISPLILFNKVDILEKEKLQEIRKIQLMYEQIGYMCLLISAYTRQNLHLVRKELKDKVAVFFGHSGSGKTTLVTILQPDLDLKIGNISETNFKGKHTTTFSQMYFWDFGGSVIDTPGMREFAMIDVEKEEIQHYFPDIFSLRDECKFHNCLHINEPKCKVLASLKKGYLEESRYNTYIKIMQESEEIRSK